MEVSVSDFGISVAEHSRGVVNADGKCTKEKAGTLEPGIRKERDWRVRGMGRSSLL